MAIGCFLRRLMGRAGRTSSIARPSRRLIVERLETRSLPAGYLPPSQFLVEPPNPGVEVAPLANAEPLDVALQYLRRRADRLQLDPVDYAAPRVTSQYTDADSGTTYIYLRQTVHGLEVANADMTVAVGRDNRVISAGGGFVRGAETRTPYDRGVVMPVEDALAAAAAAKSLPFALREIVSPPTGDDLKTVVSAPIVSRDDIPARLHYVPTEDGEIELAWQFIIRTTDSEHWYDLSVSAATGELLNDIDWGGDHATYNAIPFPNEHPNDGGFAILTDPASPVASPFGWHDTDGVAGAEFTDTRGNNVDAHLDLNADDVPDTSQPRPSGGVSLDFSGYSFDAASAPSTVQNRNIAMINLFVTINVLHDVHYMYGFTEAAGNFQVNNYGKGGLGNDPVQADAQDGSGTNNANMLTPPDGSSPRMQQYIFTAANPDRDSSLDNGIIAHEFGHGVSNRLTGGPANSGALNATQSGGMGEGWSDFHALMFTQRPTDLQNGAYPIGNYSLNQAPTGPGIRRFPYSFDKSINPLTFEAYGSSGTTTYGVARSTQVHNTGELWNSALWDLNWLLINKYGYDSDLTTGWSADPGPAHAGNKLAMKLVMDAMKLQPSNPSFIQARDAILAADTALTGGLNHFEIWTAFARRGLGANAATSGSSSTSVTVDFNVPLQFQDLQVVNTTPANAAVVTTLPTSFTVNVTVPVDPASLEASDFSVNGVPATGVNYTAGSTVITFTYSTSPVVNQGSQTMSIAAGAFLRASDSSPVLAFSGAFRYDAVSLAVVSTTPATPNGVIALTGTANLLLNFNEAVDPATVSLSDFLLSQGTATSFAFANGNTTIDLTLGSLSTEGTLTVTLPAAAIADAFGNAMPAAFVGTYQLDVVSVPYPTPLAPIAVAGSQLYQKPHSGVVSAAGDVDDYTLSLDAGQKLSVRVVPAAGLGVKVEVIGPGGSLGSKTSAAGVPAIVSALPVDTAGTYTIRVVGQASATGNYSVLATLNAGVEDESTGTNNSFGAAVSLASATTTTATLDGSFARAAIVGVTDASSAADYYSFNAVANQPISLNVANLSTGTLNLQLVGTNGSTVLATGIATSLFAKAISSFLAPTTGTYYAVVTGGAANIDYALGVVVNGVVDTEPNVSAAAPQVLSGLGAFGQVNGGTGILYDFETGSSGWTINNAIRGSGTAAGLWNISTRRGSESGHSPTQSFYYGSNGTYNTGATHAGTITSPAAVIGANSELRFNYVLLTESDTNWDAANVQISTNGGSTWTTLMGRTTGLVNTSTWTPLTISLAAFAGQTAQIRFSFDTLDSAFNNFEGWYVDDVSIGVLPDADWYSVTLNSSQTELKLSTTTPADGSGEYVNGLDPIVQLYDSAGTNLIASGVPLADGRNESIHAVGLTPSTSYRVKVSAAGVTAGDYVLSVDVGSPLNVASVAVNAHYAGISKVAVADSTVTFTTNGAHGFSAGGNVVVSGYQGANAGLNGSFTIASVPDIDTFTVTNATPGLPASLNLNTEGYALSTNSASALRGSQRSMVNSIAYTFTEPVNLAGNAFTLGTLTPTKIGPAVPATTTPAFTVTPLQGGLVWVVTWNSTPGHSIADGVYTIDLASSAVTSIATGAPMTLVRPTDTFYRLFGDSSGYESGTARVNAGDNVTLSTAWLKSTGTAGYSVAVDSDADGRVNAGDFTPFSSRWLSVWSNFTPTI